MSIQQSTTWLQSSSSVQFRTAFLSFSIGIKSTSRLIATNSFGLPTSVS
jgi:hypothetical protein